MTGLAGRGEEADEERRIGALLVASDQLVCRDGGSAARAPLGGPVPAVEPPALVHELEEAPDVFDVRIREGVVVVAPIHPLAEPLRPPDELLRRPGDLFPALTCELGEPVRLDLALRVEAEFPLDAHLNPEALTIEAVLVALVEATERLVALENVLQRAAPGRVRRASCWR